VTEEKPLVGIILAAGEGKRFGGPKQIQAMPNGETLLSRTIAAMRSSGVQHIVVVAGAHYCQVADVAEANGAMVVRNERWALGMGSSIKCAVQFVQLHLGDAISGYLVACADQAGLTAVHLAFMQIEFFTSTNDIVASEYGQSVGVPAIFRASSVNELLQIRDEQGAKPLITKELSRTKLLRDERLSVDIDTREDWFNMLHENEIGIDTDRGVKHERYS
jgi:molybdenum cofactor cytidylyltransferase